MKEELELTPEEKKELEELDKMFGVMPEQSEQQKEITDKMTEQIAAQLKKTIKNWRKEKKKEEQIKKRERKEKQKLVLEMIEGFAKDAKKNKRPKKYPRWLESFIDGDLGLDQDSHEPDQDNLGLDLDYFRPDNESIHNLYLEMREMVKNAKDPKSLNKAEFFEKLEKLREMEKEVNFEKEIRTSLSAILMFLENNKLSSLEQDRPEDGYTYLGFLQDVDLDYLEFYEPELFVEVRRFIEDITGKKMDNPYKNNRIEIYKEADPDFYDFA